jgi:hypothetical protein
MKNIYLNAGTLNEVFTEIQTSFNGVLNSNNNEFKLTLNTDLIKRIALLFLMISR